MATKLKIGFDYDETYSEDKETWGAVIGTLIAKGHEVVFVTYRDSRWENSDIENDAFDIGIPIIYTAGNQKANYYNADIWIDDNPVTIPVANDLGEMYDGCMANDDMETRLW